MESRRAFISRSLSALGAVTLARPLIASAGSSGIVKPTPPISVFSKALQWLDYNGMAEAAQALGFEGIDLTVRPGGHVLPVRVKKDLPAAVRACREKGVNIYSISTAIDDASEKFTEDIIATAADLGVQCYRMNWLQYDSRESMEKNLSQMKAKFDGLSKMNERYGIHGAYQNHDGNSFGASVWDLWYVIKDFDPKFVGCQFDVRHATVEGGNSWVNDMKIIAPYIRSYNIKDFRWVRSDGRWRAESVPLGTGMVDFVKFFEMIDEYQISGPISIHFEYNLGGADRGATTLSIPEAQVTNAMKTDLLTLRELLSK